MKKILAAIASSTMLFSGSAFATIVYFDAGGGDNDCVGYYSADRGGFDTCVIFAEDLGQGEGDISSIVAKYENDEAKWEYNDAYDFDSGDVDLGSPGSEASSGTVSWTGDLVRFFVVKGAANGDFRVFYDVDLTGDQGGCASEASSFACMSEANTLNSIDWSTANGRGWSHFTFYDTEVRVPEPATLALVGLGLLGMAARRRKMSAA